jgi:small subunit ribosomal protein S5
MTPTQPQQREQRGRRPGREQQAPEEKQFDERVINVNRVARVVKGGRRFRFQALVVVGDRKNKVGIGVSKGADVTAAVTKATEVAKKNLVTVNLYKGTIPHEAEAKVGGAHILIKPASAGTGLIAGGVVRTVLEVAGLKNVLSKSLGSTNKINTAYATVKALEEMVPQKQWVTYRKVVSSKEKVVSKAAKTPEAKTEKAEAKPAAKKPAVKKEAK